MSHNCYALLNKQPQNNSGFLSIYQTCPTLDHTSPGHGRREARRHPLSCSPQVHSQRFLLSSPSFPFSVKEVCLIFHRNSNNRPWYRIICSYILKKTLKYNRHVLIIYFTRHKYFVPQFPHLPNGRTIWPHLNKLFLAVNFSLLIDMLP